MSNELKKAIEPNSQQLNADDLISGPRTIKITRVKVSPGDQPVTIGFEGDNNKPYKPSKGMTRVMVLLWGDDESQWIGHSLTLYRNPDVKWAGLKVGGIQISHASHIDNDIQISVTMSKGNKQLMMIKKLASVPSAPPKPAPIDTETAKQNLESAASQGTAALVAAWKALPPETRNAISATGCPQEYKDIAAAADLAADTDSPI